MRFRMSDSRMHEAHASSTEADASFSAAAGALAQNRAGAGGVEKPRTPSTSSTSSTSAALRHGNRPPPPRRAQQRRDLAITGLSLVPFFGYVRRFQRYSIGNSAGDALRRIVWTAKLETALPRQRTREIESE